MRRAGGLDALGLNALDVDHYQAALPGEFYAFMVNCFTDLSAGAPFLPYWPSGTAGRVRARLVARAEDWRWSSVQGRLAGRDDGLVEVAPLIARGGGRFVALIAEEPEPAKIAALHTAVTIGRPLGAGTFLDRVAALTGSDPRPAKRGRKRRAAQEKGPRRVDGDITNLPASPGSPASQPGAERKRIGSLFAWRSMIAAGRAGRLRTPARRMKIENMHVSA